MKITESYLRKIIKEEIQKEGFFDFFSKKEKSEDNKSFVSFTTAKKIFSNIRSLNYLSDEIDDLETNFGSEKIGNLKISGNSLLFNNISNSLKKREVVMQQRGVGDIDISKGIPKNGNKFHEFDLSDEDEKKALRLLKHQAMMGN